MTLHRLIGLLVALVLLMGCSRTHLPIVTLPSEEDGHAYVAIIISGDGGWATIDKEIAQHLGRKGIPTVGLDSLRYFWFPRTQTEVGQALTQVLAQADLSWTDRKFILIGFSRGANALPFMIEEISPTLRDRIVRVALLSPSAGTAFEFRLRDWFDNSPVKNALPMEPALEALGDLDVLCIYGEDDPDAVCPHLPPGLVTVIAFPGGHHVHSEYSEVVRDILRGLPQLSEKR